MKQALELLAEKDFVGKDIPYMHTKTIEYLLRQKVCICGTHLDEGSVPYTKVKELIEYLPPQSISTTIGDFKKEAKRRANMSNNLYMLVRDNTAVISQQDDDITDLVMAALQVNWLAVMFVSVFVQSVVKLGFVMIPFAEAAMSGIEKIASVEDTSKKLHELIQNAEI